MEFFYNEHPEDDLCTTINTQDLLPFSSSQSIMLSESEVDQYTYVMPPLSGTELIKMESSYNLHTVFPALPQPKVENLNNIVLEHPDPEHWHKFPTMEIVDSNYEFDMHIDPCDNQNWLFNSQSNKVFIKLNSVIRVTFSYKPVNDSEKLFLRAMILFANSDEMHFEVKRCANHRLSMEYEGVPKEHMLRCCHPKTQYVGKEIGQEFKDRLSIVVPLDRPVIDEDQKASESILLEFLCLNSCATGINRKATAVVFTLENERREIIGKKILPFKVCSCPKRDMGREGSTVKTRKRDSSSVVSQHGKRPSKMAPEVKQEPMTPSPETSRVQQFSCLAQPTSPDPPRHTPHTFTLTMPDRDSTKHVLRCAFNEISGLMSKSETDDQTKIKCQEYCLIIKNLLETHCGRAE